MPVAIVYSVLLSDFDALLLYHASVEIEFREFNLVHRRSGPLLLMLSGHSTFTDPTLHILGLVHEMRELMLLMLLLLCQQQQQ